MPRISVRAFNGGLDLAKPIDEVAAGSLRRAKGIHPVNTQTARSRDGCTLLYPLAAHSLMSYKDARYAGSTTKFYRNGVEIKDSLSGDRLTFLRMPPTVGEDDWLFVAGGGELFKVDAAGAVSKWGIEAPPDGFTATKMVRREKPIESFDVVGDFTEAGSITTANDSTNAQEPNADSDPPGAPIALKLTVVADEEGRVYKDIVVDLSTAGTPPIASPDEDFITMWVMLDNPDALVALELAFKVGTATFDGDGETTDAYVFKFTPGDIETRVFGIGTYEDDETIQQSNEEEFLKEEVRPGRSVERRRQMSTSSVPNKKGSWGRVRVAKADFERGGTLAAAWEAITGVRITVTTNAIGPLNVWLDDLRLWGTVGMQGTYKHYITFFNENTGARSNPNPNPVITEDVDRQGIELAGLPVTSTDPQVTHVEIWRTVGDGALPFPAGSVALGTATFVDEAADYIGLHGDAGAYLAPTAIEFDNAPPEDTYNEVAGPFQGRAWWTRDAAQGAAGRVYYSSPGRPESIHGFIDVTDVDDPIQRLVVWQGGLYAFSNARVFEILGTGEPFTYRELHGCPGTTVPFAVASTPSGIFYEAADGPRLFDGSTSSPAFAASVLPLFRGDQVANIPPFVATVAAFGRGELIVSSGAYSLAVGMDGRWRDLGRGLNAIYFEEDTQEIIASYDGKIVLWEREGTTMDDNAPIPFDLEIPSQRVPVNAEGLLTRVYVDIDTQGESVIPTLILDNTTIELVPIVRANRAAPVEFARLDRARLMAVRLTGNVNKRVTVYGIEFDVHVGE